MTSKPIFLSGACALLAVAPALAAQQQDEPLEIPQIESAAGNADAVPQISRPIASQLPAEPVQQLSSQAEGRTHQGQANPEPRSSAPPPQLYTGGPTARSPEPLSTPAEGRTVAVTRVSGHDRCDPVAQRKKHDPECAHAIETRAAEFTAPQPRALTAEEHLLVQQRLREGPDTVRSAERRLATNQGNPDSLEVQSVAAAALKESQSKSPLDDAVGAGQADAKAAADALVNGILNAAPGSTVPAGPP